MVDQRGFDNQPSDPSWLDARAAAARLGVQRRTLYAYVSRGLLRSRAGERGRVRLYARDDIERLRARHDARAGHGAVAAGALRWGEPVLDSAITEVTPHGPAYRGHLAVTLAARGVAYERVAELLWSGTLPDTAAWPAPALTARRLARLVPADLAPAAAFPLVVDTLALADADRHDTRPEAFLARARTLTRVLAAALAPSGDQARLAAALAAPSVATAAAIALGRPRAAPALDTLLVLIADHELNASSFACRVVASTGADVYACLAGALAAVSGPLHGGAIDRAEALVDETGAPARAAATLRARLARGDTLPLGHPLYPDGDPRAPPMLSIARKLSPTRPRVRTALALAAAAPRVTGLQATCDLSLVALADALHLPRGSASALFSLGRVAGWVAHALEQRAAGFMLRPRARYTPSPTPPNG